MAAGRSVDMGSGAIGSRVGDPTRRTLPPAPEGYTYDPNSGRLIPIAGSATDVLAQRTRTQGIEDAARGQATAAASRRMSLEDQDRAARDTLRNRLVGLLDRPEYSSSDTSAGAASGTLAPLTPFDLSSFKFDGGGGGGAALPAEVGTIALPDTSAAQANLFARAKDQVGLQTAGSLSSLRSALAGRGILGGGAEARGTQNVLTAGQGQLGQVSRDQAIQEAGRLTDFAKIGYEGAITQRGQDITARGQDIQAQEAARNAALDAAKTSYEGQIAQRGQNVTQRGQDVAAAADRAAAARAAAATRNASVTSLLGKLY
jgi:hypothetical protein